MMAHSRLAVLPVLLASCSPSSATLYVDVRTDLVPGVEFSSARVEAIGGGGTLASEDHVAQAGDDFAAGVRVAELSGLPLGTLNLRVELRSDAGRAVLFRPVVVTLQRDTAITVLLTRDCRGIECPGTGDDPSAEACLGGRCVDPRCTAEDRSSCPLDCNAATDCPAPAACADAVCESGVCFSVGVDSRCAASEYCDPDRGCRARPPSGDAGVPGPDAGGGEPCMGAMPANCVMNSLSLSPGAGFVSADTAPYTDQWTSSCGSAGAPDHPTHFQVLSDGTFRFDYMGAVSAAISVRMGDCSGPELDCGIDSVTVPLTAGQQIAVIVETLPAGVCDSGMLGYRSL